MRLGAFFLNFVVCIGLLYSSAYGDEDAKAKLLDIQKKVDQQNAALVELKSKEGGLIEESKKLIQN